MGAFDENSGESYGLQQPVSNVWNLTQLQKKHDIESIKFTEVKSWSQRLKKRWNMETKSNENQIHAFKDHLNARYIYRK